MRKLNQEEKVNYMTTEKVPKLICSLAVPTIISMLVTTFYNMVDTYFVGKINNQATAAVGVVFSVMTLIQALGFFFGHGSGNYISRKMGERDYENAEKMASFSFFVSFFTGVLVAVICLIFMEPLAVVLGSTKTILPYTLDYMKIILLGTPFIMSSFVLNNQLRYQGSANYAMVAIVLGAIINIALDPILMFVCDLEIKGAAYATIISQIASFILLLVVSNRGQNIHISLKKCELKFVYFKEIIRGGAPSLFRQGLVSIASIILNNIAADINDATVAAMSVVSRITMFANSTLIGFGQGFQPVCGMNYGAKLYNRVREGFWFCVKYSFVFLIVLSGFAYIFAPWLVGLFRDDKEVIRIGTTVLRFQCMAFPLNSVIVLTNMMLQSTGKGIWATIVASSRQGFFFIPIVIILSELFGLTGLEISQTIADVCAFLLSLPVALYYMNQFKKGNKTNEKSFSS